MFDALARLADHRAKRVVIVGAIFFVMAGALGGSVADRLDPYGADDPATESVEAADLLDDSGFRQTALIVLLEDAQVSKPATRDRVEGLERWLRDQGEVASARGYYEPASPE